MSRHGFTIILLPVVVLLIATFLVNTQVQSGLQTGNAYNGLTRLSEMNDGFFLDNVSVPAFQNETIGCEGNTNLTCSFETISFLSPNAIPTCIIETSLTCFYNAIIGLGQLQPPAFQSFNGGQAPVFSVCINANETAPGANSIGGDNFVVECNQDYSNGTSYKFPDSSLYTNSTNVRNVYTCTNYVDFANYGSHPYAYWGCDFVPSARFGNSTFGTPHPFTPGNSNTTFGFILAVNGTSASDWEVEANAGGINAIDVQGQALIITNNGSATNARNCIVQSATAEVSPDCRGWLSAVVATNQQTETGLFGLGLATAAIGSLFLIIIGLGLGVGAGGLTFNFSLTPNTQGTRFAQTLGFSLLLWVVALSESAVLITTLGSFGETLIGLLTFILIVGIFSQTLNVF